LRDCSTLLYDADASTTPLHVAMKRLLYLLVLLAAPFLLFAAARGSIALANHALEARYPLPGHMVSVGDYRLHLFCTGTGSPTVVIEPGMGMDWVSWRDVTLKLSTTKVCVYDRAGYGWSDAGPRPRTALQIAIELHSLLSNAQIPEPYVLVGHSFGGYIVRIYASRYSDSVSGVVLVDPSDEDASNASTAAPAPPRALNIRDLIPPLGSQRLERLYRGANALPPELRLLPAAYQNRFLVASSIEQLHSERNEFDSLPITEPQVRAARFPRDLPLTVITAVRGSNRAEPSRLAGLSRFGKEVFAEDSGHSVQLDRPDAILEAVLEMLRGNHD
jgi:pimeloyl-ACP methyl ester carboxylesterase